MINAMLSAQDVKSLVERRSRRSIALLLAFKEREIDKHLPVELRELLRKTILDEVNDLTSLVVDVISYFEQP